MPNLCSVYKELRYFKKWTQKLLCYFSRTIMAIIYLIINSENVGGGSEPYWSKASYPLFKDSDVLHFPVCGWQIVTVIPRSMLKRCSNGFTKKKKNSEHYLSGWPEMSISQLPYRTQSTSFKLNEQ